MPAQVLLNPTLGRLVLRRLHFRRPLFTQTYVAKVLGFSTGHMSAIANGAAPLGLDAAHALAVHAQDPVAVFGPELLAIGHEVVPLPIDNTGEIDITAEVGTATLPLAKLVSRALESVRTEGDGGADITDDELEGLLEELPALERMITMLRRESVRRGLSVVGG